MIKDIIKLSETFPTTELQSNVKTEIKVNTNIDVELKGKHTTASLGILCLTGVCTYALKLYFSK